jgi:hypothetical protein
MARDYALEYEREQKKYRRLTIRIPADLAQAFYAKCEADDVRPSDWVLTKIFEECRRDLDLNVVIYQGFMFNWNELVSEMDPAIYQQLVDILPADTTNEEFLDQYGELDPSIYEIIDPYGAPSRSPEE